MCHSLGQVLGCAYTICSYGQIQISCTSPSGSPCLPNRVSSYTPSVLICCIRLLCDWWFRLYHHIAYICNFSLFALMWLVLMALLCAAIWRDSVFFLWFPFLSQVEVFWCEMLFISRLKRSSSCFSSHFLFSSYFHSVVHRVVSIVSDSCNQSSFVLFYVVLESLCRCVTLSTMLAHPLPPHFHDTYSLSTLFLGCNALCMVISFLILWSIWIKFSDSL